jgi:hypothetical protein
MEMIKFCFEGKRMKSIFITISAVILLLSSTLLNSPIAAKVTKSKIYKAEKILKKRGFSKYAIVALLHGQIYRITHNFTKSMSFEKGAVYQKRAGIFVGNLAKRHGLENPSVMVYTQYEPDTGRKLAIMGMVAFAKTVSQCMSNNRPWRDCTMNYHPIDGCYLKNSQRKKCVIAGNAWAHYQTTDEWGKLNKYSNHCWNYEKGPGIILPYQTKLKSQIDLTKVVRHEKKQVIQSLKKAKSTPQKKFRETKTNNFLRRPVCRTTVSQGPWCLSTTQGC